MVQKYYCFHTFEELEKVITQIKADENYESSSSILIQLYNPKIGVDDDKVTDYINTHCNKVCLIGLTCANIAEEKYDIKNRPIELNVTYFHKTKLVEIDFDMSDATGFVAGRIINEQLEYLENAKCLQVCYNCSSEVISSFFNEFSHHHVPVFGAKAGRSIRELNTPKVYGRRCGINSIVVVIFVGEDLHIYMDNCLGFKEIGVEMAITRTHGDNIVTEIDHNKAVDIYAKYLKVKPNEYFVQNVCEFPLVFHRGNSLVARVPLAQDNHGAIHFSSDVAKGETFRLSYGTPDNLFKVVQKSVSALSEFKPEAVFLFECGNRLRFLKDRYTEEIEVYKEISSELSFAVGYAELFITPEGEGGALNSALVTVGLSEAPDHNDVITPCINKIEETDDELDEREYIPFTERILYFLERTSLELDSMNRELGRIAYTDQLTKIYNRWELEHKLDENLEAVRLDGANTSLIFMDIDHFKHVNDTFGHDVGDMVLKAVVNIVKDKLKKNHVFGRWGGEEFIYILPDTDLEDAIAFAEELRKEIDETVFVLVHHVTMSFGVTLAHLEDDRLSFVKRADDALYEAKQTGRNRVVTKL